MITLVDSNVILDLVTAEPKWGRWSAEALSRAADESALAINPLIFAEVSIGFAIALQNAGSSQRRSSIHLALNHHAR